MRIASSDRQSLRRTRGKHPNGLTRNPVREKNFLTNSAAPRAGSSVTGGRIIRILAQSSRYDGRLHRNRTSRIKPFLLFVLLLVVARRLALSSERHIHTWRRLDLFMPARTRHRHLVSSPGEGSKL